MKGRHKIKTGFDAQLLRMNAYNSQFSAGQYFFDRVYTQGPDPSVTASNSGHGFASLLLGVPASGTLDVYTRGCSCISIIGQDTFMTIGASPTA